MKLLSARKTEWKEGEGGKERERGREGETRKAKHNTRFQNIEKFSRALLSKQMV